MRKWKLLSWSHPTAWREPAGKLYRSHRARKTVRIIAIVLVAFGLLGFFAAPPLIRSQLQSRLSIALQRPVTVQQVHLNPFTLRLALDGLHIGDRDGHSRFVDVDHLVINASWSSLFRLAPILDQLQLDRPQILLSRDAPQHFNFSDLIDRFAGGPAKPDASPARFALYNISVHQGDIVFDDGVLKAHHEIAQLELGIPFIASLPSDTDIFVQPLLAMTVDGSAVRLAGQIKPFASTRESVMHFHIDHLDLPSYLGYVPTPLPVAVAKGQLSGELDLHFIADPKTPQLSLTGTLQLDQLAANSKDSTPLLSLQQAQAQLTDVQPLLSRYTLGTLRLDQPELHYVSLAGGHSNFDPLLGGGKPTDGSTTAVRIARMDLTGGHLVYVDRTGTSPTQLNVENLHGSISGLSTVAAPAATIDMAAQLNGGSLKAKGTVDIAASQFHGAVSLDGVDIAPLEAIGDPTLAASISGKLAAHGQLQAQWSGPFDAQLSTTQITLSDVALMPKKHKDSEVHWKNLQLGLDQFDLIKQQAKLGTVSMQGLTVNAQRLANGNIDLAELASSTAGSSTSASSTRAAAGHKKAPKGTNDSGVWHWHIDHFTLDDGALALTDHKTPGKPQTLKVSKIRLKADGLSDDMHQLLKLDTSGTIGKSGNYQVSGTVTPQPLNAQLQIKTTRLDLAPFENYGSVPLNVLVSSALLSSDGRVRYMEHGDQSRVNYRGRVTLGRVRVQDKVSGDDFLRWQALTLSGLNVQLGDGAPKISIGTLALDQVYARLIINANGRLNTQDVITNPAAAAPVSVTRAETVPAPAASTPSPAIAANIPAPQVHIGAITVANSQLNYTDNFIKPNYTANITQLTGKIGGFGTDAGPPADLSLQGQLDDNSPVDIEGSINPLAPVAFLDISGKAEGIELTNLSAYSGKYTGYPITKGRLNADVHYKLDQRKLSADNHIFIDQLTFGDRIEGKGISHLPVKLAVALLKDSQGRIDVHLPVSGSLDDPKFSIGGLVWHAFVNLIGRAVTAPFRLLASAFSGSSGQDLGYVEFAPGSSELSADAQKRLTLIVKALTDKPSLNLDIIGRTDPTKDESGLRTVTVDQLVRAEQRDDEGDKDDAKAPAAEAPLSPDDYNKYLAKAYKHAKFKKPRDLIGLTKSQPPDTMKSMLEANVPTDTDAMRHLAQQRADAVRSWLHGKVPDKRLFVLAPKLDAKGIDDKGLTTRVDFGLH